MAMSELSARSAPITISSERPSSAGTTDWSLPSVIVASPLPLACRRRLRAAGDYVLLPAGELRLARSILHETLHARALVLGREQAREVQPLDLKPGVQVGVQAF